MADTIIAQTLAACLGKGHHPEDVDPRKQYGYHEIQCPICDYVYYEDSSG